MMEEKMQLKKDACKGVQIGINNSAHLVFICPKCKYFLNTTKVYEHRYKGKSTNRETFIYLHCNECNRNFEIKFYWEQLIHGRTCFFRTYEHDKEDALKEVDRLIEIERKEKCQQKKN